MSGQGGFGIAAYGAPPSIGPWPGDGAPPFPSDGNPPTTPSPDFVRMLDQYRNAYAVRFPQPPKPMQETAVAIVREQIERLVRLRLSPAVTDAATRAELDAIIGALTVAVSVP